MSTCLLVAASGLPAEKSSARKGQVCSGKQALGWGSALCSRFRLLARLLTCPVLHLVQLQRCGGDRAEKVLEQTKGTAQVPAETSCRGGGAGPFSSCLLGSPGTQVPGPDAGITDKTPGAYFT